MAGKRGLLQTDVDVAKFILYTMDKIGESQWHWLQYHYAILPPHHTALEIAKICTLAEKRIPGLGRRYVQNIASIKNRTKNDDDYDHIIQIFSEMLVINQIFLMPWPDDAIFRYEILGTTGKRPEMMIEIEEQRFLFEVKAPSLIKHVKERQTRDLQVPGRMLPLEITKSFAEDDQITLPRDNPVKDFLISTDQKFSDFGEVEGANVLVIVWDDFVYEPITSLINEKTGLLTENSYYKDENGIAVEFLKIDGVIVVRHLSYFYYGLAERELPDRHGIFDFGDHDSLPNVFFPTRWGKKNPLLHHR